MAKISIWDSTRPKNSTNLEWCKEVINELLDGFINQEKAKLDKEKSVFSLHELEVMKLDPIKVDSLYHFPGGYENNGHWGYEKNQTTFVMNAEKILCEKFGILLEDFDDVECGIASAIEYEYHRVNGADKIIQCMKEYARLMCDKQKEICLLRTGLVPYKGLTGTYLDVDRKCIANSPYPEEIQNSTIC